MWRGYAKPSASVPACNRELNETFTQCEIVPRPFYGELR